MDNIDHVRPFFTPHMYSIIPSSVPVTHIGKLIFTKLIHMLKHQALNGSTIVTVIALLIEFVIVFSHHPI